MILDEITGHLEAGGVSPVVWELFDGAPDECVAVYEYSGRPPLHVKAKRTAVAEYPRIQVRARSKKAERAAALARRAFELLDGFSGTLSGVRYDRISALQTPYRDPGGRDEAGRIAYLANYELKRITNTEGG